MGHYKTLARRFQQRRFRELNPGYYTDYQAAYYQASKHPCADCGQPVSKRAVRCRPCANRSRKCT